MEGIEIYYKVKCNKVFSGLNTRGVLPRVGTQGLAFLYMLMAIRFFLCMKVFKEI